MPPLPPPPPPPTPLQASSSSHFLQNFLGFRSPPVCRKKKKSTLVYQIFNSGYDINSNTLKSNQLFFHDRASAVTNKRDEVLGMKLIVSHFNLVGPSFSSPLLSPGQDRTGKASEFPCPKNNRPCLCNVRRVEIFLRHGQATLAAAKIIHNL